MLLHTNHHRMQHCGAVNSVLTEKVILKPHKNGVEIYYYETLLLAAASMLMLGDQQKR